MDILLNVNPVMSSNNLKGLRHLYDTIETQVRGLKSLDVSADSYGSLLFSTLLNKLPQELRLFLSRKVGDDHCKLDKQMEHLEEEVAAGSQATSRRPVAGLHTAAALLTGGTEAQTCCYCQQSHSARSCDRMAHSLRSWPMFHLPEEKTYSRAVLIKGQVHSLTGTTT